MNTRWTYTRLDGLQRTLTVLPSEIIDARRAGARWNPDMRTQFGTQCSHRNMMRLRESPEWRIAVIDYARLHGLNEEALQLSMCKRPKQARTAAARAADAIERLTTRKFGIELEVVANKTRRQVCNRLLAAGVQCYVGYWDSPIRGAWKIGTDNSVSPSLQQGNRGYEYAMEIVSPPLKGDRGLAEVKKVTDALNGIATANRSCGMHVHVDVAGITVNQLRNICTAWLNNEGAVNRLLPHSRRHNRYCLDNGAYVSRRHLREAVTLEDLKLEMQGSRYYKLNLRAMDRHGTVEFRYHHGTADGEKVTRQIQFCLAFVEHHIASDCTDQYPDDAHFQLMQITAALPRQMRQEFTSYWDGLRQRRPA